MENQALQHQPVILSADVIKMIRELPEDERQTIARTFTNVVVLSQKLSEQSLTPLQSVIWAMISSSIQCDNRRFMSRLGQCCC